MFKYLLLFVCLFTSYASQGQDNATYREYAKNYLTYGFSDPDPIPSTKKIYPYFRFDGFTDNGVEKEWKVVELENDYISVQIMPEIGGKVWTAMDKGSGKHFFYNNEVVKFRDIAMRGPWVSGGIEANYGIIGHTPNTATPVDYLVRSNDDGSVSCYISTLDLLTRTRWVLEVRLEKDKAYFTTESYWFNSTQVEKPYYTWMNAGIPAGDDLRFLYPGNYSIGHGGQATNWPIDKEGNDLSRYIENNFGGSKSYHIEGAHSKYFGALWEKDDFGMIHYAKREDKLGKKIFLWAQSEQGRIWEDLLTDDSGQYVEIQSGRLFNQNQIQSSSTPFKQIGFAPFSNDRWKEYWFPFKEIDGFTNANLIGAFNIQKSGDSLSIKIFPVQPIQDSLKVLNANGDVIAKAFVKANPSEATKSIVLVAKGEIPATIELKGHMLDLQEDRNTHSLSRPVQIAENFNKNGAYSEYLQGRDLAAFRDYQRAEEKISSSLENDPSFVPALVEMTKLKLFRLQYDSAFYFSKTALSIDTYDAEANYYYGVAAAKLSRTYDALDGFEVATLTPLFRNAAYSELCHQYIKMNDFVKAREYAELSLKSNPDNLDVLQVLYILARIAKDEKLMQDTADKVEKLNPLNPFLNFETYFQTPTDGNKNIFTGSIRNEMPVETYLELGIWYANLGRYDESKTVLELAPPTPITLYWLAWLNKETPSQSKKLLAEAQQHSASFVFPFREETAMVLEWAAKETQTWQPDYFQALIEDFRGNRKNAIDLLKNHSNVDFAPFYIVRARLNKDVSLASSLDDIRMATQLDPKEWRYGRILSETLIQLENYNEGLQVLEKHYAANKTNYIIGMDLVKAYIFTNQYRHAETVLSTLKVLPFEGATDARRYYRETKLMLAQAALEKQKYKNALMKIGEAEEWPNRLGVGKPYPEMVNEDLENWMKALVYKQMGELDLHRKYLNEVKNKDINEASYLKMIQSISSKGDQRMF